MLVIIITFLLGYYAGTNKISYEWRDYKPKITVISKEPPQSVGTFDLALFWQSLEKLQNLYYDKSALDPQKLLNGAISGMFQSLGDPYTVFLPPTQNTDFKQGLAGQFEGIGAELGLRDKQIIVVAPLDGSPAEKSGIKAQDAILKVDGKETDGWTLSQAVEKIRGPKGTEVVLTILSKGEKEPVEIKILRDTITIKSVTSWIKKIKDVEKIKIEKTLKASEDQKIAYVRLSQFGDNTNKEWLSVANALSLELDKDKSIKGVILDIRNNPGGYLGDAAFISSEFLRSGIVVIQDKGNGERSKYSVSRKGLLLDIPLVVLINKGSASASEIVAGALRDHSRAKLIGETSFGKGTIQQAEDLGGGAGLHITIAKWLTPKETWVNGKGLTPDIAVLLNEKEKDRDTQLEKAIEELVK